MNILAEKQKECFNPTLSDADRAVKEKEFLDLYYKLRNKDENGFLGRLSLKTRKRLHKLILLVYIIKNHLGGFSHEVIKDERTKTDRPTNI